MTEDVKLPGVEAYKGSLYDDPTEELEVLTELEFRKLWANKHHHEVERHLGSGLLHAIASGEQLNAAKKEVVKKRGDGTWQPWVEANFDGHYSTAADYMRLAREAKARNLEIPDQVSQMSIGEFRRTITPPKEDKPKEPEQQDDPTEQDNVLTLVPQPDISELERKVAELEEKNRKIAERVQKAQEAKKKALQSKKEEKEKAATLQREQEETKERWFQQYTEELARLHAKHGVEPETNIGSLFDHPDTGEALLEAFHKQGNIRVKEAAELVIKVTGLFAAGLNDYTPEEASRSVVEFMHWLDSREVYEEVDRVRAWIDEFAEKLDEATRPGIRAINN